VMASVDGTDNYIAEIEALIEALAAEPEGGRIIIVMDATSPVTAWMRFGRCHNRRKLQFREHTRLDVLDQQLARHEASSGRNRM
jgi:ribonuclease HI